MAAIVVNRQLNLAEFRRQLVLRLPPYARPLIVRITDRINSTATFKYVKTDLVREGYDPALTGDTIYFNNSLREAFVRLDSALYARIQTGDVRL